MKPKNYQNTHKIQKITKIPLKPKKMTKIPLKPKNDQNTLKTQKITKIPPKTQIFKWVGLRLIQIKWVMGGFMDMDKNCYP